MKTDAQITRQVRRQFSHLPVEVQDAQIALRVRNRDREVARVAEHVASQRAYQRERAIRQMAHDGGCATLPLMPRHSIQFAGDF